MNEINTAGLREDVAKKLGPFLNEIKGAGSIHSVHLVGSALTADYDEKRSDINTVVVLDRMDFRFLEFLSNLGPKYRDKGLAAPMVMTPEYIKSSLDAFPIEFLDFRLIHKTVYGPDMLEGLEIEPRYLRLQCEREIKTKLVALRQGFISALNNEELLKGLLTRSITGSVPLFRAVIQLFNGAPPVPRLEVVASLNRLTGLKTEGFENILSLKAGALKPTGAALRQLFEEYYIEVEALGRKIDELSH